MIWLAVRTWRERMRLCGLGGFVVSQMAWMSLGLASTGPRVHAGNLPLWSVAVRAAIAAHRLIWPVRALLFNRALMRGSGQPARFARWLLLGEALDDDHP